MPERGSRSSPPPMPWPGRGHIAPASRPSPGTCVSNVAGSSRDSACSESSTKFLSDRVMGPSSLREAGQGEGMLGPSRTGLQQEESQTKQRDPGRARAWHSPVPAQDQALAQCRPRQLPGSARLGPPPRGTVPITLPDAAPSASPLNPAARQRALQRGCCSHRH